MLMNVSQSQAQGDSDETDMDWHTKYNAHLQCTQDSDSAGVAL